MAKTVLSKATGIMVQRGYGQVEPNHLSAQRNGQIYAQLPADKDIEILENGMFVKYDYAKGVCDFTGEGEWMLVLNEVKTYRDYESYNDFAMVKSDYNARVYSPLGQDENGFNYPEMMPDETRMVPRVFKTMVGDIFTTNTVKADYNTITVGATLVVDTDGYLKAGTPADGEMTWQVVKKYTLADEQPAVKIMRIA